MQIELSEESDDLVHIVACLGRVYSPGSTYRLYVRLLNTLTPAERHRAGIIYSQLEFSSKPRPSTL